MQTHLRVAAVPRGLILSVVIAAVLAACSTTPVRTSCLNFRRQDLPCWPEHVKS